MKILILETRKLSYNSSSVFLMSICDILKERGNEVIHCLINDVVADSELLESFSGKHFDAILDVNSILPLAEDDNGRYLDSIDAPFINFIVDHPMHVHEYLNIRLKKYYVICLDKHHKEYIEQYYPHIKGVTAIPLGGFDISRYKDLPDKDAFVFENRKYDILFPATYTPAEYYRSILEEESNGKYLQYAEEILSKILSSDNTPIHEMYRSITDFKAERFAARMFKARCIDRYIRDYFRDKVLDELLCAGFKVDVAGARWEMYKGKGSKNLKIHRQRNYSDMVEMMAQAKIVLNVQPLFTQAPHDRIFNAMANGAVPLTDTCEYIEENYAKNMLIYDKCNINESITYLCDTIKNVDKLKEISKGLRKSAEQFETWEDRCSKIGVFIREVCSGK